MAMLRPGSQAAACVAAHVSTAPSLLITARLLHFSLCSASPQAHALFPCLHSTCACCPLPADPYRSSSTAPVLLTCLCTHAVPRCTAAPPSTL